jgi:hypothetical protein
MAQEGFSMRPQYILSSRQLTALETLLEGEKGKAAAYVRDALGYLRFAATTIYYLPRDETERREFVRLAKKAGFTPAESLGNITGPEGLTEAKKRANINARSGAGRTRNLRRTG